MNTPTNNNEPICTGRLLIDAVHQFGAGDPDAENAERPMTGIPCGGFHFFIFERDLAIEMQVVVCEHAGFEGCVELRLIPKTEDVHVLNCKPNGFGTQLAAGDFAMFGFEVGFELILPGKGEIGNW